MRLALAVIAIFVAFVIGFVMTWRRLHDVTRPEIATGLVALVSATLLDPRFWLITIVICGIYWLNRK